MLTNRTMLKEKVKEFREAGFSPAEEGWGGWLGRYQKALYELDQERTLVKLERNRSPSMEL